MRKSLKNKVRFAICLRDDAPWLELRKVYRVLPDETAAAANFVRVVDEFEEDYLYPENNFVFIDLPKEKQRYIPDIEPPRRKPKPHDRSIASASRRKLIKSA